MNVIYPPRFMVETMIWWGRTYNPLCLINPLFFRTIQIVNVILFGPFFIFGLFTFIRGLTWIRTPAIMWSVCSLFSLVLIISEELYGTYATINPSPILYGYYFMHIFVALLTLYRTYKPFPFGGYLRLIH